MQKSAILFLVMCGQTYAMDPTTPRLRRDTNLAIAPEERRRMKVDTVQPISIMVAAWVVTPSTQLDVHDEIIIQKHPNGMHSIKHFSRSKGMRETPCDLVAALELVSTSDNNLHTILLQHTKDQFNLALPNNPWYKHTLATHSAAVVSTILILAAFFR